MLLELAGIEASVIIMLLTVESFVWFSAPLKKEGWTFVRRLFFASSAISLLLWTTWIHKTLCLLRKSFFLAAHCMGVGLLVLVLPIMLLGFLLFPDILATWRKS